LAIGAPIDNKKNEPASLNEMELQDKMNRSSKPLDKHKGVLKKIDDTQQGTVKNY
jgi:hypothetical protein